MNADGLKTFFCSYIRSIATYAAPAWFMLLFDEKVQRTGTHNILPDMGYEERLKLLDIPCFKMNLCQIVADSSHLLFSCVVFNENRKSSCDHTIFDPQMYSYAKMCPLFVPSFYVQNK